MSSRNGKLLVVPWNKLTEELAGLREGLKTLKNVSEVGKKLDGLGAELEKMQTQVLPISKIDELISTVTDSVESSLGKKIDDLAKSVTGTDNSKKSQNQ